MASPILELLLAVRRKIRCQVLRPLLLVSATLFFVSLGAGSAAAQSADDYYHNGAQYFVFGENEKAKTAVETGQRRYPNDQKLNELAALLKQQEQPPQKGDKQDQNKDKEKQNDKDKEKSDKQKQDEQKEKEKQDKASQQDQQQQQQQQQQQGQDKKEQQKKQEEAQKQGQQGQSSEQPEDSEGAPDKARMIRMTPQQAVQLLEALKGEEKVMPFRPVMKTNRHDRVFKDW